MVDLTLQLAQMGNELFVEEQNLLSTAIKNQVGIKRSSYRILTEAQQEASEKGEYEAELRIRLKKQVVGEEILEICKNSIDIVEKHLLPAGKYDKIVYSG